MKRLILASGSPRRRQILKDAGYTFEVIVPDVEEKVNGHSINQIALNLSIQKISAVKNKNENWVKTEKLVISCDTIVVYQEQVLGKPKDRKQAIDYLSLLSGDTHMVITSFAIWDCQKDEVYCDLDRTEIVFRPLHAVEIANYVDTAKPFDKAGAYGIQEEAKKFVQEIKGSYLNVVGFPLEKFKEVIKEKAWNIGSL